MTGGSGTDTRATACASCVRRDIEDVIVRLAVTSDAADLAAMAGLVTDAVTLVASGQPAGLQHGRDAMLEYVRTATADRAARGEFGRHLVTNISVELGCDGTARARSYVTFIVTASDGTARIHGLGCYEDEFVQLDGTWRLASRIVVTDRNRALATNA